MKDISRRFHTGVMSCYDPGMARPLRIQYDGALYHVTSRGNARKAIFNDDRDCEPFLGILSKVNKRYNWLCHTCCIMNNHYHLIIETPIRMLRRQAS